MLLALLGCATPESPNPPAACEGACCGATTLDIGDPASHDPTQGFIPKTDGQEAMVVHGPQGGWHILASVLASNSDLYTVITYTIALLPEETQLSNNLYNLALTPYGDCGAVFYDMFGYLDTTPIVDGELNTPPELLIGRSMRLDITLTDIAGNTASDAVEVVGIPDPKDVDGGTDDTGTGDTGAGDTGAGDSGTGDSGAGDSGAGNSGTGTRVRQGR